MDRRDTVRIFRQRLADVIARAGGSRAAFAERIGIDRRPRAGAVGGQRSAAAGGDVAAIAAINR
jgi:hypothetical protein